MDNWGYNPYKWSYNPNRYFHVQRSVVGVTLVLVMW